MKLKALYSEFNAQKNTLHNMKSMSRPGMDKAGKAPDSKVKVPISSSDRRNLLLCSSKLCLPYQIKLVCITIN